ncbi:MAG: DUF4424 domain-containing protein [Deltaproteobacteria bacterium]|nr:DUF4424 domain-containing protein [Deltaproteobacteria bacterium]
MKTWFLGAVALAILPSLSLANDTSVSRPGKQLQFLQENDVSIEKEVLEIWGYKVDVKYVMVNHSTKAKTLDIAFPLPSIQLDRILFDEFFDMPMEYAEMEMKLTVDTRDVPGVWEDMYTYKNKPLPLRINFSGVSYENCSAMDEKCAPVCNAILQATGEKDCSQAAGGIELTRMFRWKYEFPPRKPIEVHHAYVVSHGWNWLQKTETASISLLSQKNIMGVTSPEDAFCMNNAGALPETPGTQDAYAFGWVEYVLSTGANWKGPIKEFTLIAHPRIESDIVSSCFPGLKKVAPGTYMAEVVNFSPSGDLAVGFFPGNNPSAESSIFQSTFSPGELPPVETSTTRASGINPSLLIVLGALGGLLAVGVGVYFLRPYVTRYFKNPGGKP